MPDRPFVRARPGQLRLTESYAYRFVVGSNPSAEPVRAPSGRIEALTPLDGQHTFPREAVNDAPALETVVQMGNLLLLPIQDPKLPPRSQAPVVFPLMLQLPDGPQAELANDRRAGWSFVEFGAEEPTVRPLSAGVMVFDEPVAADQDVFRRFMQQFSEASRGLPEAAEAKPIVEVVVSEAVPTRRETALERGVARVRDFFRGTAPSAPPPEPEAVRKEDESVIDARQQLRALATFEKGLVVVFLLEVAWPEHLAEQVQSIGLRRARVHWPHPVPHPSNLQLLIGDLSAERPGHWRFDPATACLEWEGILAGVPISEEGTTQLRYKFPVVALKIDSPLDLHGQDELLADFEIEVQGGLLSGRRPLLYDAAGQPMRVLAPNQPVGGLIDAVRNLSAPVSRVVGGGAAPEPPGVPTTVRTRLTAEVTVVLSDAFARRHFLPRWRLLFQGVRFDAMRVEDVRRALGDLLFQIRAAHLADKPDLAFALWADRVEAESGERLELLVHCRAVDLTTTERETQLQSGVKLRTPIATGDLEFNLYGAARGDDRQLQEVFNQLTVLLKQRLTSVAGLR